MFLNSCIERIIVRDHIIMMMMTMMTTVMTEEEDEGDGPMKGDQ